MSDIVAISAGRSGLHSLAACSDGSAYGWGYNNRGQCGNGTLGNNQEAPVRVRTSATTYLDLGEPDELSTIEVDAGVIHSIARDVDFNVWEWGHGNVYAHQVPGGEMGTTYLEGIIEIASCYQSLALTADGYVYQWDPQDNWQNEYPVRIRGGEMGTVYLENIIAIGMGRMPGNDNYAHGLALDIDGNVWEWTDYDSPQTRYTPENSPAIRIISKTSSLWTMVLPIS